MPIYEGIGLINDKAPVVIQFGHTVTKAGFAGEVSPRCIIPSVVKDRRYLNKSRRIYDYTSEDDLYHLLVEFLHFIYNKHLLITPKDRKVVIVESIFTKTLERRIIGKVLFIHYEVFNVLWIPHHLATVCVTGSDTGLVINIGSEEAIVVPVHTGITFLSSISSQELGSNAFDKNLQNLIDTQHEEKINLKAHELEDLRVRTCFVTSLERGKLIQDEKLGELKKFAKSFDYDPSDNNVFKIEGIVRESAAEFWFRNEDLDGISLPIMILDSLLRVPIDARKVLAKSIILTGGTLMIPGFKRRLLEELNALSKTYNNGQCSEYEFRIFEMIAKENWIGWLGGAIYGTTEAMNLRSLSKENFLKTGVIPDWSSPDLGSTTSGQNVISSKSL